MDMFTKTFERALASILVAGIVVSLGVVASRKDGDDQSVAHRVAAFLRIDQDKEKQDNTNSSGAEATGGAADDQASLSPATPEEAMGQENESSEEMTVPEVSASTPAETTTPTAAKEAGTYVVKEGDTYGCIAEKYYGSFEHWTEIMSANNAPRIGYEERRLFIGEILTLPSVGTVKPKSDLCQ